MNTDKSPENIQRMFNAIAKDYDKLNGIISFGTHKSIKQASVNLLDIEPAARVLDVCTGTGDIAEIIKSKFPDTEVIGADFSVKMLEIARNKVPHVEFIAADALNLPFSDNSFDVITISYGLRNIEDRKGALRELYRILKFGGELMHLDFGEKTFTGAVFDRVVPVLAGLFGANTGAYGYLVKSKQEFPVPDGLSREFTAEGFRQKRQRDFLFKAAACRIYAK